MAQPEPQPSQFSQLSATTQMVTIVIGSSAVAILVLICLAIVRALLNCLRSCTEGWFRRGRSAENLEERLIQGDADVDEPLPSASVGATHVPKKNLKALVKESQRANKARKQSAADPAQKHPLFLHTLREKDSVSGIAWSPDADALCTACEDRVVRRHALKGPEVEAGMTVQQIRMVATPVDVAFGRNSTQIAVVAKGLLERASVSMYTLEQGKPGAKAEEQWKLDEVFKNEPALRMVSALSSTGSRALILCCSEKKEAKLISDKGDVLSVIEPSSFQNNDITLSGDGRLLSVASFTADAKVWEVQFSRDGGTFKGTPKVMDLKGHKSQVTAVGISQSSKKAATASKDGTLKIWNLDVRHHLKEDARCLSTTAQDVPKGHCYSRLVFGPGDVLAAAWSSHVHLIDASTGRLVMTIDEAHEGPITSLAWAPKILETKSGKVPVLATAGEDGRVRLWRAPQ